MYLAVVSPPFRIRDVGYAGFIVKIKVTTNYKF